jgi:glycine cleavage system H lipoate-binding protein
VWTPLSGRIIALNDELRAKPGLLESQEPSLSWLARLLPSSREREVAQLLGDSEQSNDDRDPERGEGISWSLRSS